MLSFFFQGVLALNNCIMGTKAAPSYFISAEFAVLNQIVNCCAGDAQGGHSFFHGVCDPGGGCVHLC